MTRSKRTLAETDANAEVAPASKRTSTGKARSKENDAIQPTADENEPAVSSTAKSPASKQQTPSKNKEAKVPGDADGKTWMCLCHVRGKRCGWDKSCMCGRYADANPAETWIVTKKGFELHKDWGLEQYQRDQDNFRMHIFSDWSGYGTCEVMENMFLAFNKEVKKKTNDIWAIWSIIEGMALFLNRPAGLEQWYGIDDSEGNAKRVMLFGTALLTTIDILIKNSLFKSENSDIRNIALILGHFLNFVHDMKEMCVANEDGWKATVLERADEHEIKPYMISINHIISEIREGKDDATSDEDGTPRPEIGTRREGLENAAKSYESKPWVGVITLESLKAGVERSWTHWDWATELRAYSKAQAVKVGPFGPTYGKRIGGKFYDLTIKASQRQMKQYRLGPEESDEDRE